MAIFNLFKNVTTFYTNIFWYVQPLKSCFLQKDTQTDRRRRSISSLDFLFQAWAETFYNLYSWSSDPLIHFTGVLTPHRPKIDDPANRKSQQKQHHQMFLSLDYWCYYIFILDFGEI